MTWDAGAKLLAFFVVVSGLVLGYLRLLRFGNERKKLDGQPFSEKLKATINLYVDWFFIVTIPLGIVLFLAWVSGEL